MTDLLANSTREFAVAAQQNPLLVRTMIAADPGSEPVCHRVLASFTAHPVAWFVFRAEAVIIVAIVSDRKILAGLGKPLTCIANCTRSVGLAIQPPHESNRATLSR
jgi:hypothetical protein